VLARFSQTLNKQIDSYFNDIANSNSNETLGKLPVVGLYFHHGMGMKKRNLTTMNWL